MIDYTKIISTVNGLIKAETNRPIVLKDGPQKQPSYPFCAYTVTSPYLSQTSHVQGDTLTEDVELVISYTWITRNGVDEYLELVQLVNNTASMLKHPTTRQKLSDADLSLVRIDGFGNRDTFLSIETERQMGFDVRLRTRHSDAREIEYINDVLQIQGG